MKHPISPMVIGLEQTNKQASQQQCSGEVSACEVGRNTPSVRASINAAYLPGAPRSLTYPSLPVLSLILSLFL